MKWIKASSEGYVDGYARWENQQSTPGKLAEILILPNIDEGLVDEIGNPYDTKGVILKLNFLPEKFNDEDARRTFYNSPEGPKVVFANISCAKTIEDRFGKIAEYVVYKGTDVSFNFDISEMQLLDAVLNFVSEKYESIDAATLTEMKNHPRVFFELPIGKEDPVIIEIKKLLASLASSYGNKEYEALLNSVTSKIESLGTIRFSDESLLMAAQRFLIQQYHAQKPAIDLLLYFDKKNKLTPKEHARLGYLLSKKLENNDHKQLIEIISHALQGFMKIKQGFEWDEAHIQEAQISLNNVISSLINDFSDFEQVQKTLRPFIEIYKNKIFDAGPWTDNSFEHKNLDKLNNSSYLAVKDVARLMLDVVLAKKEALEFRDQNKQQNVYSFYNRARTSANSETENKSSKENNNSFYNRVRTPR